jgi:hypothetical protein
MLNKIAVSLILILALAACAPAPLPTTTAAPTDAPTSTLEPTTTQTTAPTDTATAAPTATATQVPWPTGPGECTIETYASTTIYSRPDYASDAFFQTDASFVTAIGGRTDSGWLGFDPGIAQAANMGPFRLRWFNFNDVIVSGDCLHVPVLWAPQAGFCYDMPMESTQVFASPDAASTLVTTLEPEEFAAILGFNGGDWAQVDLANGNTGLNSLGWVDETTLNMNGASCSDLPTISS